MAGGVELILQPTRYCEIWSLPRVVDCSRTLSPKLQATKKTPKAEILAFINEDLAGHIADVDLSQGPLLGVYL